MREGIKATLIACGHCDLTDLLPYLEVGNQDQIAALQIMLPWVYPNGRSHCNDPKVIETEVPRNDMITVDVKTQDTQLNPKPNPRPKKTMTPRHKFKRIKKGGKVQKIQSPGVHKMKFKLSQKIADSQNTPIKSPNISCDFTVLDTGIPKSDSSKMVLEVQDTKQNYKTKSLKMSKGVCHKCL